MMKYSQIIFVGIFDFVMGGIMIDDEWIQRSKRLKTSEECVVQQSMAGSRHQFVAQEHDDKK